MIKIRPDGAELFLRMDVRTDRHDVANNILSQFYEIAYKSQYSNTKHEIHKLFKLEQRRVRTTIPHDRLKRGLSPTKQQ